MYKPHLHDIFFFSDIATKEKSQGFLFRSVLKCIPNLIIEVSSNEKITEIIPQHMISHDPGIREDAILVLKRIVTFFPHYRYAVIRGISIFILKLSDEFPVLIQSSLGRLVELMRVWRVCLADKEMAEEIQNFKIPYIGSNQHHKFSPFEQSEDPVDFHASEMDAIGLIFLCSADVQIRHSAFELLHCVRSLSNDIQDITERECLDNKLIPETKPIFIIDALEENEASLLSFYFNFYLFISISVLIMYAFLMTYLFLNHPG